MFTKIRLADSGHKLPLPGQPGRILTGDEVIAVDLNQPFWVQLIRDGSIVVATKADDKEGQK